MQKDVSQRDKLIPLRKFAVEGLYSLAYLSLLVQRNKLKAEKIGRNYFTCRKWFDEYLERHAADEKVARYKKLVNRVDEATNTGNAVNGVGTEAKIPQKLGKEKLSLFIYKTAVITMAVFVILILTNVLFMKSYQDNGRVAGEAEEDPSIIDIASSTNITE